MMLNRVIGVLLVGGMLCGAFAAHAQGAAPRAPAGAQPGAALLPGSAEPAMLPQVTTPPSITNAPSGEAPGRVQAPTSRATPAPQPARSGATPSTDSAERNDFQELVAQTSGRTLPLFGYNLFQDVPSTFAPVDNVPVTPDYTVGPGDELLIRAWGQLDVDYRALVDRNGAISIPRVGVINVAGVKYQDLNAYIKTVLSRNFRNFELVVTMGQLRSIQIFAVGQARRPGSYTVSSLSTLVNAIFAAGGPSSRGSMRAIQLKRGNRVVTELDVYDLLVFGDKSKDVPLLPGDVIYFPPAGPLAALSGSVNNPAIFELRGETSLSTLVKWAGGLTTTAQTRRATIERIDDRKFRIVDQFSIDNEAFAKPIRDGDVVSVFSISPKFENAVTLRGHVAAPLRYPWREGMRVRDLIPEKEALITADYYQRKNLAVQTTAIAGQEQLRTEVRRLAAEINWDYAVIERLSESDLSSTLLPFNLGKAILEGDESQNLPLRPGDVVTVFSKADISVPVARQSRFIRLEGEINQAGVYRAEAGETLRQVIVRVGGLSRNAYLFGAEFTRESTRQLQEKRFDEAINRLEQDIQRNATARTRNVLTSEDAAQARAELENQRALVAKLRTLKPTGRIVLELPEGARVADLPDLELEDGDRLYIPPRSSIVSVFGSVYNEGAFIYRPEKRFVDYLAQAGGPTRDADRHSIYLIRPDGSVISRRQETGLMGSLEGMRLVPGDAIVVPEEFEKTSLTRILKDWTAILYQFGLGAAAIHVLRK